MPRKPKLDALVVADLVYPGPGGKFIILGTFNRWCVREAPATLKSRWGTSCVVYVNVTELQGPFSLRIRVRFLKTDQVIAESPSLDGESASPLESLEFAVGVPPLKIPEAGTYAIELVINDELVGSKRITVEISTED